jgi:2-oxoglutarate ferredoxin oxidoreductase subunit beta
VSFNDHDGSTKSYRFTRERYHEVAPVDFVPLQREITAPSPAAGQVTSVTMHDGSVVRFRSVEAGYDPTDRDAAYAFVRDRQAAGEVVTGLLYIEQGAPDMHEQLHTVETPLVDLPYEVLCPGAGELAKLMEEYR